jgi:hypothetical protein
MAVWLWRAGRGRGRLPGVSGERAAQDGEDVVAVLTGGVAVAADVEPVLGGVFAGEAAGYLLLCLGGAHAALADVVRGPDPGVRGEPQLVVFSVAAEFEQVTAGCWAVECFGPGMRWTADRPTVTARRNSVISGSAATAGMQAWPASPARCQALIRPRSARRAWAGQMASG